MRKLHPCDNSSLLWTCNWESVSQQIIRMHGCVLRCFLLLFLYYCFAGMVTPSVSPLLSQRIIKSIWFDSPAVMGTESIVTKAPVYLPSASLQLLSHTFCFLHHSHFFYHLSIWGFAQCYLSTYILWGLMPSSF